MDDKTYGVVDFFRIPGQGFYVALYRGNVSEIFKQRMANKFP